MRNLKRALSLGLTAAMISGLMVMGAGAVSYPDSDQIQNQTAVEILGEIGVMVGDDNGNFNPTQDVTRAEMAVIITRILYGNDLNVDQFKGMNLFTDVPAWAEGFVNLCASLDIVAGVGDGKFAPNETVTAAQAALMLSRALGYFQNNAEFGNDWALAAIRRATSAGIIGDDMVLAANEGLSRDNVAQMTFNTLTKAVPVQYNELLNVYYNENQGITYALTFNYLQTLGYTNFDLVYDNGDTTIYGRPATTWGIGTYRTTTSDKDSGSRYDEALDANGGLISSNVQILSRDEIITIANEPTYTYTDGTAEEDIYDDLGDARCNDQRGQKAEDEYDWTVYVNGEEVAADDVVIPARNEGDDYAYTGEGVQTEIYVDDADKTVTVVEINYYLGQVSSVNETEGTVSIRTVSDDADLDDRTFSTTEFAKGDYVVFTIDQNADDDFYICEMTAPETVDGTVTRVNKDNTSDNSYLFLDRENRYYYSDHMAYDLNDETVVQHPSLEEDYTLFLDPNGYVLAYSGDTTKSFLYVQDSDEELSDWEARVVLADGTDDVVMVKDELDNGDQAAVQYGKADDVDWATSQDDMDEYESWLSDELTVPYTTRTKITDIDYQIWEYETNADGDLYTLTGRDTRYMSDVEINNGEAYIDFGANRRDVLIDNSTIFVDVDGNVAYTGYDAVPDVSNADIAYVLADDNDRDVAEIVYIINGDFYDADAIFFVLTSEKRDTEKYDGDYYFEFEDMYVDGYDRDGLYVSYDALKGLLPSLDEDDGDADRSKVVDQEIKDNMEGKVFKVLKSEDGTYITQIALVDDWDPAATATSSALDVMEDYWTDVENPNWNLSKYKTNSDTTYVLVEEIYDYDRNDDPIALDKYDVSEGGYSDIIEWRDWNDEDNDGYITTVQVLKAEDGTANLVYIYKYNPDFYKYDISVYVNDEFVEPVIQVEGKDYALVDLKAYLEDYGKEGYEFSYAVDGKAVANFPVGGMAMIENIDSDVRIDITVTAPSVTNGNATLIVEDNDATAQSISPFANEYTFYVDLPTARDARDGAYVVSYTETVEINGVEVYTRNLADVPAAWINATTGSVTNSPARNMNMGEKFVVIVSNVEVTPAEQPADLPELSVSGSNVKVYVENALATPTDDTPAGMVYGIEAGSEVVVDGLGLTSDTYILPGNIVATVNARGQLVFTMPDADVDLSAMKAVAFAVHYAEGMEVADNTAIVWDDEANNVAYLSGVASLTFTMDGAAAGAKYGKFATATAIQPNPAWSGDNVVTLGTASNFGADCWVKPVAEVILDSGVTAKHGNDTFTGTGYFAIGTELTLDGGIYSVYKQTAGETNYGLAIDKDTVTADAHYTAGWTVTLGKGVEAQIGTEWVKDTKIAVYGGRTVTLRNTEGTAIIEAPANNGVLVLDGDATTVVSDSTPIGNNMTLVAATAVTADSNVTVKFLGDETSEVSFTNDTAYVLTDTTLTVNAFGNKTIAVSGATAIPGTGSVSFVVGNTSVTVSAS